MTRRNVRINGTAISPGFGDGNAYIVKDFPHLAVDDMPIEKSQIEDEHLRIRKAFNAVIEDLSKTAEHVRSLIDESFAEIFSAQIAMLQDPLLLQETRAFLEKELINAEKTVMTVFKLFTERLNKSNNSTINEKADDFTDLLKRVINKLSKKNVRRFSHIPPGSVLITDRLLPSDAIGLPRKNINGIVLEVGGAASHAAILTREIGIPAVSDVSDARLLVGKSDFILVDGNDGVVIINPDGDSIHMYKERKLRDSMKHRQVACCAREVAVTVDGIKIPIQANIGDRDDALCAMENGADGIGLYRIEQLYLSLDHLPYCDYIESEIANVLKPIDHLPVNIRLLDTGNDKQIPFLSYPDESNPALGLRGIRFLLKYPDLLKEQLKAILNLSKTFNIGILVPMVTSVEDILNLKHIIQQCAEHLSINLIPPLGAMIETPAAALLADDIAKQVDFLSIGTNDLTQYTMASGRENHLVSEYYIDAHPAVMKLISLMINSVNGKQVALCGELASHEESIPQLLQAGIDALSVNPLQIPIVKDIVRNVNLSSSR